MHSNLKKTALVDLTLLLMPGLEGNPAACNLETCHVLGNAVCLLQHALHGYISQVQADIHRLLLLL